MEIQVFGDLHGRDNWKERVNLNKDKIIFLGDYVDSFDYSYEIIINNLKDLIKFKKQYPDKVVLLLGNHDNMYLFEARAWVCSGYRATYAHEIGELLRKNRKLFKAAHQEKNWLFTHAGLNRVIFKKLLKEFKGIVDFKENYADFLNEIFESRPISLNSVSYHRGGWENYGGIFWQDMNEYHLDIHIKELNQVVGHQPVQEIMVKKYKGNRVYWIDTESHPKFLEPAVLELDLDKV